MSQVQFKGYAITDANLWTKFDVIEYQPKNFDDNDVELKIAYCGVCGSDVHTITEGWGKIPTPLVVGHEIVGQVVRVGANVTQFKAGDRVGVGAQIGSCYKCRACQNDQENYCPTKIDTYNDKYPDGVFTQGGYSTAIRANQQFVFAIPDDLPLKYASSMLCAGLTVYSPLKRHGCGPGKKVGIVGIGGLGHYALLFAKAMGAEVYAFTHSSRKIDDIKKMGADHVIVTGNNTDFAKPLHMMLDLIVCALDVGEGMPLTEYLNMLWVHGKFVMVGLPNEPLPTMKAFDFLNGAFLGGSHIGNKLEAEEMLQLAASKGIRPWIEEMPMSQCGEAVQKVKNGDVRYRLVLKQDISPISIE